MGVPGWAVPPLDKAVRVRAGTSYWVTALTAAS